MIRCTTSSTGMNASSTRSKEYRRLKCTNGIPVPMIMIIPTNTTSSSQYCGGGRSEENSNDITHPEHNEKQRR